MELPCGRIGKARSMREVTGAMQGRITVDNVQ